MSQPQNPQSQDNEASFPKLLEKMRPEMSRALGQSIGIEYFLRVALTTWRKSEFIQKCSYKSVIACLMDIAQLQLSPDSLLGEAYLVPFWNSKMNSYEATTILGYKGFVKMVRRNTNVATLTSDVVYSKDKFTYRKGSQRVLIHEPVLEGDRGYPIGAYAYIAFVGGGEDFEFVREDYIDRIKRSSKSADKDGSPWKLWWEAQWKKTALKQLLKIADISPEVAEALSKDNANEGAIDVEATVSAEPSTQKSALATPALAAPSAPDPVLQQLNQQRPEPEPVARRNRPKRAEAQAAGPAPQAADPAPATANPPTEPAADGAAESLFGEL